MRYKGDELGWKVRGLKLLGGQLGNVLDGELLFGGLYVSCFILGDVGRLEDELLRR